MEEVPEMSVLEIPMTQPTAKIGRSERSPSQDGALVEKDAEKSQADFEAAYSADAESDEAPKADDPVAGKTADNQNKDADATLTADAKEKEPRGGAQTTQLPTEETAIETTAEPETETAPVEAPVRRPRGSETSELAFAQRVQAGKGTAAAKALVEHPPVADGPDAEAPAPGSTGKTAGLNETLSKKDVRDPGAAVTGSGAARGETATDLVTKDTQKTAVTGSSPTADQSTFVAEQAIAPRERRSKDEAPRLTRAPDVTPSLKPQAKLQASAPSATAPSQQVAPLVSQTDAAPMDLQLSPVGDVDTPTSWDPRNAAPASLAQTLARPETPGMIGRQMAEVLQRFPDRPVELSLNPEELGRVRLSISAAEGGITVQVLAERPETLDLMRRHIDQLAREFQALGYESINFAFNEGQAEPDTGDRRSGEGSRMSNDSTNDADSGTPIPVTMTASTGVDIRV